MHVIELNPYAPRPFVFTDAALCLRDSIIAAGFDSAVLVNESDPQAISIVLGALPPHTRLVEQLDPRKTVIFNFEQLGSTSAVANAAYRDWLRGRLVADYHSHNLPYLEEMNGGTQRAYELPVVPSVSVLSAGAAPADKTVDVLFFGTLSERRHEIIRRLQAAGMTVETVAGAYGAELTPAILRARIVLHVHYYETGLFPVARFLQPVVLGVPIVCETSLFSKGSDWSRSGLVFAGYDDLVAACTDLLQAPEAQAERARLTRQFAWGLDFASPFRHMLGDVLGGLAPGPLRRSS